MKLKELLDVDKLIKHCKARVVNVQHHHYAPLAIYNYGQKAQFENIWDDVTCITRGLVVDQSTDEIVARPFRKFFNINTTWKPETMVENLPASAPEITDKLDGSLGILYRHNGLTAIATRGSFASDQAAWASSWYSKRMYDAVWPEGWTPLFEIIYPDNRIVVKYDEEGLWLLSLVNIETGEEMPHSEVEKIGQSNGCRVVQLHSKSVEECHTENTDNAEGYVLTWPFAGKPPLKIKIKFQEYVRLHHLITGISPKEIWRMLRDGESFDWMLTNVPSHYAEWVNFWRNGLQSEFGRIEQKAQAIWASCNLPKNGKDKATRKALADFFTIGDRRTVSGVLFKMLDKQPYEEVIWKMCREKTHDEQPFKREEG